MNTHSAWLFDGWDFGGLDVDDIKDVQEEAYQKGRACLRRDYLDACDDFILKFRDQTALFKEHQDEIYKRAREGDSNCEKIIHNTRRLVALSETILSNN